MDTKSKKFDRTWVTKTIAFLLAVVLFAAATVKTAAFVLQAEDGDWDINDYISDYLKDSDLPVERSAGFLRRFRSYVWEYANKAAKLGDGSEQAYQTYLDAQAMLTQKAVDAAIGNILGKSGNGSPVALQKYLNDGMITLEKIADHKKHYVHGDIFVNGGSYYFEDNDGNGVDYDTGLIYDESEAYDGEGVLPTTMVTEPQEWYTEQDFDFQSSFSIPQSVTKQLMEGQVAVELCHTTLDYYRENGGMQSVTCDGYYAVTPDKTQFSLSVPQTYAAFQRHYQSFKEALSRIQNILFFYVDNNTKRIISNNKTLDGELFDANTKAQLQKFRLNGSINLATGEAVYSKALQETIDTGDCGSYLDLGFVLENLTEQKTPATVYIALRDSFTKNDELRTMVHNEAVFKAEFGSAFRFALIALAVIALCVLYLMLRAGRRHDDDALHMLPLDRIFTLLRTAINLGLCVLLGWAWCMMLGWMDDNSMRGAPMFTLLALIAAAAMASLIDWILYVVRHIKAHTLLKNLFLVWLIRKIRTWHKAYRDAHPKKEKLPVEYADLYKDAKKRVLLFGFLPNAVLGILVVIFMASEAWFLSVPLLFVIFGYDVWLAVYVLRYAYRVRAGIEAVHRIRGGDYDVHLAVDDRSPALAVFARDVNSINDGLRIAVSNAIKDEHMRTELITNVSHDLKTPLTSIINYVDLLSRCDIQDETAKEYLAVLGEKSERLKKLIEDLVEASKASSGNIRVDLVDLRLAELANQIAGEYEDAFRERNLELITSADSDVIVRADSKLCYRVLDNLMNNVKKYAMPGTRVYLSLTQEDNFGVLTLLNVSQTQLNIPVEELMERFVRGDASRSTDGSGLGLSIAQNLCELQGAKLELSISGDLFTAKVKFQKA